MDENTRNYASREELLAKIEELETSNELLEAEVNGLKVTLQVCDEGLKSWQRRYASLNESVEALCLEYIDNQGTMFFDEIVELFDIELTKTVTVQFRVSLEVQATVPASMDEDEIAEELTIAKLDYEFLGNGDFVIEDISFGDLEVE